MCGHESFCFLVSDGFPSPRFITPLSTPAYSEVKGHRNAFSVLFVTLADPWEGLAIVGFSPGPNSS